MREIKFRARCFADDVERMVYFGAQEFDNGVFAWPMPNDICHIDEYTSPLMQYTGLKDKNGKEIYEGDILTFDAHEWNRSTMKLKYEWEYPRWVVEWDNEEGEWQTGGGLNKECSVYKEIIGNIYENPELIKQ